VRGAGGPAGAWVAQPTVPGPPAADRAWTTSCRPCLDH